MNNAPAHYSKLICRWLLITTGVLIFLHLLLQHVNLNIFHQQNGYFFELSNRLDMDDESSIPTWFSQIIFLAISCAALLAATLEKLRVKRTLWIVIGIVAVSLSIDEIAGIHEQVLQTVHVLLFHQAAPTITANAWFVVLPFVLVAVGLLARQMVRHFPKRLLTVTGLGLAIFLTGAVGVDIITQGIEFPQFSHEFLLQGIFVAVEEGLELIGSIIVLYGIMEYIEKHYHKRIAKSLAALKEKS